MVLDAISQHCVLKIHVEFEIMVIGTCCASLETDSFGNKLYSEASNGWKIGQSGQSMRRKGENLNQWTVQSRLGHIIKLESTRLPNMMWCTSDDVA